MKDRKSQVNNLVKWLIAATIMVLCAIATCNAQTIDTDSSIFPNQDFAQKQTGTVTMLTFTTKGKTVHIPIIFAYWTADKSIPNRKMVVFVDDKSLGYPMLQFSLENTPIIEYFKIDNTNE